MREGYTNINGRKKKKKNGEDNTKEQKKLTVSMNTTIHP